MLRSPAGPRYSALVILFPLALLGAACGDDTTGADNDAGVGRESGAGTDSGSVGDGAVPDTTRPVVLASSPVDAATDASPRTTLTATFSKAMSPSTLSNASFTVTQGAVSVDGTVSYFDDTVTFVPKAGLALGTTYRATISTAAADLAGNTLATPYSWSFTTDATVPIGPAPVLLGASGDFVILAKSKISNVPTSAVTGNVGLSPAAGSYITGFALTNAGSHWTAPEVTGSLFAANSDAPTPSNLTTAVGSMETAYTDAAARPTSTGAFHDLQGGSIGGLTLPPGVYTWASSVTIPTDITIAGARNDTWIFQISGDLKMSSAQNMTLSGGARAKNIVWQVAGLVDLGTTAHAEGVVLTQTAINLGTGASINGRLLAQTAVTIANSTVTAPAP